MSDIHQSQLHPSENKFHKGNRSDGKNYWLTPWEDPVFVALKEEFGPFDFDPCPYPLPDGFDGLTCEWGQRNYVNIPFGSIMHEGKKKGPTFWVRKAIEEWRKGKLVVFVFPIDKWVLLLLKAILGEHGHVRNLGDVKWLATDDRKPGKGTGRHIACFILKPDINEEGAAGIKPGPSEPSPPADRREIVAWFKDRIDKYATQLNATGQADVAHLLRRDAQIILAALDGGR